MIDLQYKKVIVTGSEGFFGSYIFRNLTKRGVNAVAVPSGTVDLTNIDQTINFFINQNADYCIHAAGFNGGISYNIDFPARILQANTVMGLNVHEACRVTEIKKVVSIMSSCAYPDTGMEILNEKDFWNGPPNPTIKYHGLAKRMLQAASEAYKKQFNLNAVTTCVTNLYGEYDTFNVKRTKVVGALIRKVFDAKIEGVDHMECWGTGKPLREFMHASDAAEGVIQALEKYEDSFEPINIGTGNEISIKDLIEKIVDIAEFDGEVRWDTSKPDGQMKKLLDVSKMKEILDVEPISIDEGLRRTMHWYSNHKSIADSRI
jgi:GDP-L-fucose synthase